MTSFYFIISSARNCKIIFFPRHFVCFSKTESQYVALPQVQMVLDQRTMVFFFFLKKPVIYFKFQIHKTERTLGTSYPTFSFCFICSC